jgi:Pyruvate/2-oxoacid:ferredoxin oxidoreductase gamma subunit
MADRETIITGGGGSGVGIIAGVLVVALVVLGFFYLANNSSGSRTVDVDVPAVSVDVAPDGQ